MYVEFANFYVTAVLFRTLFTLNASLPVTASGYEILCSAEIADDQNSGDHSLEIEWTKNGQKITGNTYQSKILKSINFSHL